MYAERELESAQGRQEPKMRIPEADIAAIKVKLSYCGLHIALTNIKLPENRTR